MVLGSNLACGNRGRSGLHPRRPQHPAGTVTLDYRLVRQNAGNICFDGNDDRFTLFLTVAVKEQPLEE